MDRLLSIDGGQPIRPEDWEFIQNVEQALLAAILNGLLPENTGFKVCGLDITNVGGIITIAEGYYFDGQEIVYIPATEVHQGDDGLLCITITSTTSTQRTFHDLSVHDVWELRRGTITFEATVPPGSVAFNSSPLIDQLAAEILTHLNAGLTTIGTLAYMSGFSHATGYSWAWFGKNTLNCFMILGSFHATVAGGQIFTLPVGNRPSGDIVGFFFNKTNTPGVVTIKKNGQVFVDGASLTEVNYISFQYFNTFIDPVQGTLPALGGNTIGVD